MSSSFSAEVSEYWDVFASNVDWSAAKMSLTTSTFGVVAGAPSAIVDEKFPMVLIDRCTV